MTKLRLLVAMAFMVSIVAALASTAIADPKSGGSGGSSDDCANAQQDAGALNNLAMIEEQAAQTDPYGFAGHIAAATTFRIVAQQIVNDACGSTSPEVVSADSTAGQATIGTPGVPDCAGQTTSSLAQLGDTLGSPGLGGLAALTGMSVQQIKDAVRAFCDS